MNTLHYAVLRGDGSGRIESVGHIHALLSGPILAAPRTIRIPDAAFQGMQVAPHHWAMRDGDIVHIGPEPLPLDMARLQALVELERQAAQQRGRHVTPGMGEVYAAKRREAAAWASGDRDPAHTPMLTAEAAALGIGADELATSVLSRAAACDAALAQIEAARQAAKRRIAAATSAVEIAAVKFNPTPDGD